MNVPASAVIMGRAAKDAGRLSEFFDLWYGGHGQISREELTDAIGEYDYKVEDARRAWNRQFRDMVEAAS